MITCIGCQKFSFKRVAAEDARRGKGHCSLRAPFIRHAATKERDCEEYVVVEQSVVSARKAFLGMVYK